MLFIVNPKAARGKCLYTWEAFYNEIKHNLGDHKVVYTKKSQDAEVMAKEHVAEGYQTIIAVGGDGTFNEVLNGVAEKGITLGILPFGTGNDLARTLGIPHTIKELAELFKRKIHNTLDINIAKMNGRYFASAAGVGFDGLVAYDVNQNNVIKNLGKIGYFISAIKLMFSYSPLKFSISIDDQTKSFDKTWLVAVGNGRYYGGGMNICPQAICNDDVLDLCIVSNLSKLRFLKLFPSVYTGEHIQHEEIVTLLQGKSIMIQPSRPMIAHADGELVQADSIQISLCKNKQTYLIP